MDLSDYLTDLQYYMIILPHHTEVLFFPEGYQIASIEFHMFLVLFLLMYMLIAFFSSLANSLP